MKNIKYFYSKFFFLLAIIMVTTISCERDIADDATIATFPKNGEVYIDGFSPGLEYLPFGGSVLDAFSVDEETKYKGSSSMRFDVPNVGDPSGSYAGAIFPDYGGRDLSDFDALTFWAKATQARALNEIGFGQDFLENKFLVVQNNLQLTTNWRKYTIAIPDASKLIRESGLFWYAEGPENETGFTFWVDELQFETLGTIGQPRPSIAGGEDITLTSFLGTQTAVSLLQNTVNLGTGTDQTITIAPSYFEFSSSNPDAITVNELGIMTTVGMGTSVITATLNGVEAKGSIKLTVLGNLQTAPVPTQEAADVISIFSDAYTNIPVDYYNGYWAPFQTTLGQNDIEINGDNIINYSNLNFVGIQFAVDVPTVNATEMTHFHLDVLALNDVEAGDFFTVRIVDIGADNAFGGSDDTSGEITLTNTSLETNKWFSLDVPLSDFPTLSSRANLAQIVFVTDTTITDVYVDNIYMYKGGGGGPTGPTTAAPSPTIDAGSVISVFSDAYTDISGTNFNPGWGQSTVYSEFPIGGNNSMLYTGLDYQGIELGSSQDVSGMDYLHIDYWTDNSTELNAYLVSEGPVEAAKVLTVPTSGWTSIDIPLSDFASVDLMDIIQLKFDGNGTIYLDNLFFYKDGGSATEPTIAAPTPTIDAGNVISVFSDAYTDISGTDYNPGWGQSTVYSEFSIGGNNSMLYTGLDYQGIQLGSNQDVSGMDYLHIDFWTANSSGLNAFLISSGPVETAKTLSVPTSGWTSIDIPLADFSPVDLADIIQLKFDGNGDIYLDNLFFYKDGAAPTEPTTAAPTPTRDEGNVISVFSDAYTDIAGTDYNPGWGQSTIYSEFPIGGNNSMLYTGLDYQGIALGSNQDISGMDFLHIDFWTANSTALNAFLISSGPVETAKTLSVPTSGWTSIDIPLADFSPVDLADIIQLKFDGNGDIYLDNIYFYKNTVSVNYDLSLPIDFETSGYGANWAWNVFENGANPPLEYVANPDPSGLNTSTTVAKITAFQAGQPWVGCETAHGEMGLTFTLDATNTLIKIMVYKSVISDVGIKFATAAGGAQPELKVANTLINQWEELTFDFSSYIGLGDTNGLDQIIVFPDFDLGGRTADNVVYFDNITFN